MGETIPAHCPLCLPLPDAIPHHQGCERWHRAYSYWKVTSKVVRPGGGLFRDLQPMMLSSFFRVAQYFHRESSAIRFDHFK